ncbi:TetR/AcrR family transcriptional regulator [Methylobacterium brachiatum]|uniref:Helix-turn-helix domain-containing protein n=1 Tax=Methylobacterium brachiatum TaxID=269660 RepID=A0ABV1R8X0_9HYPH
MEEARAKLVQAARRAFAIEGYDAASMGELTAEVGLTRGALYHNVDDRKGPLQTVSDQIDAGMADRLRSVGERTGYAWGLLE